MQPETAKIGISEILPIAMLLVVVSIGVAFGLNVLSDLQSDACTDAGGYFDETGDGSCTNWANHSKAGGLALADDGYNATDSGMEGVSKIPSKMPLIATILVAALVIGILVSYMVARFR
jgi:hypothetical protein